MTTIIIAIVFEIVIFALGFLYEMYVQSKWSSGSIVDPLDARKHASEIINHLRQRANALEWGGNMDAYEFCRNIKEELKGDRTQLEILIAQFHMAGCTIDIVPVDQLPEEIPGERIVINPLVKS